MNNKIKEIESIFRRFFKKPVYAPSLSLLEPDGEFSCGCKRIDDYNISFCYFHVKNVKRNEDFILYYYFDKKKRVPVTYHRDGIPVEEWCGK